MAMDGLPGPVQEQSAKAIAIELGVAEALASVARALDQADGMAEVERLRTVVREHVGALAALGRDPVGHLMDGLVATGSGSRPTQAISSAERGFAAAAQVYADLYTTARVLYEPEVCDLAERHLAHHIDGLQVMARLLPGALARELNLDGLFCRCICPSCGIGACLCVRNSVATVADAWGWPGLSMGDGVELHSPPRPGSQLDAAGIHERDRVLSVDGAPVRSNAELQAALRTHPLGETAQLSVQRSTGELVEVPVRHISDFP
jgi:PDZ domain